LLLKITFNKNTHREIVEYRCLMHVLLSMPFLRFKANDTHSKNVLINVHLFQFHLLVVFFLVHVHLFEFFLFFDGSFHIAKRKFWKYFTKIVYITIYHFGRKIFPLFTLVYIISVRICEIISLNSRDESRVFMYCHQMTNLQQQHCNSV